MNDVSPVTARRMTYAELAEIRGISVDSAERLVRRRRWPKQAGNDGLVRVTVPPDEAHEPERGRRRGRQAGRQGGHPPADIIPAIREAIRGMLEPLSAQVVEAAAEAIRVRGQLAEAVGRAERAEQRVGEVTAELNRERERTTEATGRADRLQVELDAFKAPKPAPATKWGKFLAWRRWPA